MFNNIIPSIFNGIFGQEASSTPEYLQLFYSYKDRVLNDNGFLSSQSLTISRYANLPIQSNIINAWFVDAGYKFEELYNVSKLYSLFNTTDLIQNTTTAQPIIYNDILNFIGVDEYMSVDITGYQSILIVAKRIGIDTEFKLFDNVFGIGEINGTTLYLGSNAAVDGFYEVDIKAIVVLNTVSNTLMIDYLKDYYSIVNVTASPTIIPVGASETVKTIAEVNALTPDPNTAILFTRGETFEGTLIIPTSGTINNPITYSSFGIGAKPKIYGSEVISGWTLHSGNIYKATFATTINQLFVDDVRMQVARYPETGYANVDAAPTTSSLTCNALNGALNYTGVKCLIHSSPYGLETKTVTSSSGTTLTLDGVPFGDVNVNEKFILVGKLEFLTKAGQWFYDTITNTVYLWTPVGDSPIGYEVRGSTSDYGIVASSKNYITIKDLNILQQKTRGVSLTTCDYAVIDNNTISFADAKGIYAVLGSDNITVSNNTVTGANHMGIEVFGSGSTIQYNEVDNTALPENLGLTGIGSWYMGSAIYNEGTGNINDNIIDEVGSSGIHFVSGAHNVLRNYITNICRVKNDGGGIYTSNPVSYGTEATIGSIIRYNTVMYGSGIGSAPYAEGIYLDESSGGVTVEYNTVAYMSNAGIYAHRGNAHTIRYNKVYDCYLGLNNKWDGRNTGLSYNTIYSTASGDKSVRYFEDTYTTVVFDNNKYINHYGSAGNFNFYINGGSDQFLTFAGWQSATSKDASSTVDNTTLSTNYGERLLVNPTSAAKTFYLNNASNITNEETDASVSSDISLAAYESIILTGLNLDCISETYDMVAPTITAFDIPATASSKTINISTFTASSDVTKYLITESSSTPLLTDANWSSTPQTTFTTSVGGSVTLYAWVRDAAGNISTSVSDNITITLPDANLGYETVYATLFYADARRTMPVTMPESGTINSVTMYHEAGNTGNFLIGVYSDNSNSPGDLIAVTTATSVTSSEEWQTFNLITPVHVNSGNRVWLAWVTSIGGLAIRGQGGTLGRKADANYVYADGMPVSFGASSLVYFDYSIYCTYTPD